MRKNASGYIRVYFPEHHRSHRDGYVLEHIVVAEKMVGRKLVDDEVVHHKDRNRANNKPENLQVMTKTDHLKLHAIEDKEKRKQMISQKQMNKRGKLPHGYYYLKGVGFGRNTEIIEDK